MKQKQKIKIEWLPILVSVGFGYGLYLMYLLALREFMPVLNASQLAHIAGFLCCALSARYLTG